MAYNPFNIFRRNQKALFAVLTVFIMIMFTLSFGSGDAIQRFTQWLGGRSRGDVVCKIDGSSIKDSDLARVRRERVMANMFMTAAAAQTAATVKEYANQQQSRLSDNGKQMATAASQAEFYMSNPQLLSNPMFGRTAQQSIREAEQLIALTLESPEAKSEDKDVALAFRTLLVLRGHRLQSDGEHFFLNAPNRTSRDAIDFILWEKKAEQLGIRFTRDDVKVLLGREFYGFFKSDVEVRKALAGREGFNIDACLDALASEFKVRSAQAAVLGHPDPNNPRRIGAPLFSIPFEAFEFYREQCSPATYDVIAVPALAFVDKVKGEPTEREIKELYDKYANDEPNPIKETFGFKEPRKLAISWLAITGEEPYYLKLAAEQVKVGEALARASGMETVPVPGIGGGWGLSLIAPLVLKEPAVDAAYTATVNQFKFQLRNEYSSASVFVRDLLPTSVVRPATPVSALGAMVGQSLPFGSPAVAAALAVGAPIGYEIRDRIRTGFPLVLGAAPSPALFPTAIGGAAAYTLAEPKPLPIEAVRQELLKTTVAARAKALAHGTQSNFISPDAPAEKGDIARFVEEVDKLSDKGKPKDKAAVEKYIKEFMAARGLTKQGEQFGSSTAPRDEWSIDEDPGLRPLVLAQKEGLSRARGPHGGNQYIPFGRSFFWTAQPDPTSFSMRRVPSSGTYSPKPYPPEDRAQSFDEGRARYVYWVTEDEQPKKRNLTTARDAVVAAWKQIKARELARTRANALAEAIRNDPKSDAVLLSQAVAEQAFKLRSEISLDNEKGHRRARKFVLNNVCPLTPADPTSPDMFQPGANPFGRVQPFGLTESENIPYPTMDMVNALLDNRDKPAKTVVVMTDAPKDTYYVATLIQRDLKTPEEFKQNVYAQNGPAHDIVNMMYQGETARKTRQSVLKLLKGEFKYEETDEQKKKLDEGTQSGDRD